MNKLSAVFGCFVFFLFFISCSGEKKTDVSSYSGLNLEQIEKEKTVQLHSAGLNRWLAGGQDSISLLYFYAEWCQRCRSFRPVLLSLLDQEKIPLRTALINSDREKKAVTDCGVSSLPTLKFYKNHKLLYTAVGALKEQELLQLIRKLSNQ